MKTKTKKTKAMCIGCRDNVMNGHNNIGVKHCWKFSKASVVQRILVAYDERPPFDRDTVTVLSCYRTPGFVHVKPYELDADGYWKR